MGFGDPPKRVWVRFGPEREIAEWVGINKWTGDMIVRFFWFDILMEVDPFDTSEA